MTTMSFNCSSEPKYIKMKQVVSAIEAYSQTRAQDTAMFINRNLQNLSVTIDLSVFDPHTNITTEFFVSLYQLMNKMEQGSPFTWYCVDVLVNACRNPAMRLELIHTYQFIPCLSRLLGDHLTQEKKLVLLKLMLDLTCGIKISWQIPHLPHLMMTLARWIQSPDMEVVILCLGILVNLCYKNLPAVYTLMANVDVKKLLRFFSALKGPTVELYTSKLLVVLDYSGNDMPKTVMTKLVTLTFQSIIESYTKRDIILLRQTIEFYLDVSKQRSLEVRMDDDFYKEHLMNIFEIIESNGIPMETNCHDSQYESRDPECMALLFEFLDSLVEMKLPAILDNNFPFIITAALKWLQNDLVAPHAMAILRSIAVTVRQDQLHILQPLVIGLPIFLMMIKGGGGGGDISMQKNKISGILQLLKAMNQVETIRHKIMEQLEVTSLQALFVPLLGDDTSPRLKAIDADSGTIDSVNLYIHSISLIDQMANYDASWKGLLITLLRHKEIHMVLSQALIGSSSDVKALVLSMAKSSLFPVEMVAEMMSNLQPLVHVESKSKSMQTINELSFPVLSVAQVEQVDSVVSKFKEAMEQNNLSNITTKNVMELYEFKLVSMGHAERAAMVSMEAASERCTQLQLRNAQITAELNRSHQLLFHMQHCYEQSNKLKDELNEQTKSLENRVDAERGRLKVAKSQLLQKEEELNERAAQLEETLLKVDQVTKKLNETAEAKRLLEEQYNKLQQYINKIEDNSTRLEKAVQKKDEMIRSLNSSLERSSIQIKDLEAVLHEREAELMALRKDLEDVKRDLMARKQMLDTITKVATSQLT